MPRYQREFLEEIVDALHAVHGRHEGIRAVHARGTSCAGSFTATPAAAALTRAHHMQGAPVPVAARFSNGSGDPDAPDRRRDGRGLAVKFDLPNGEQTDMVALNLPVFFVRTPEDFLALQRTLVPDPATGAPDPMAVMAFVGDHPEAMPAIQHAMAFLPPESYARVLYRGLHAFRYVVGAGDGAWIRTRWVPDAGEATLTPEDAKGMPDAYLDAELRARIGSGAVTFTLHGQIAGGDDPVTDPTAAWPEDRDDVVLGHLSLDRMDDASADALYDPTMLTDGIEASDDPILHARSGAYGVSFKRRRRA